MARRRLLSDEQLAPFWAWASDERAIVRHYTLSRADLDLIGKKRTASNQLGFAVLMCGMRFPGRVLDVTETPPAVVLAFIADQVGATPAQFATYRQRPTNRREHVAELMASLGCRAFDTDAYRELLALAVPLAQGTPREALREIGRIERALFTLDWIKNPDLRRRAHLGLNKGEARNALARAVYFCRLGEVRDRSFENQFFRASGLNLLVAAIILWNTKYLEVAYTELRRQGGTINDDLLRHVAPLGWEHIGLTGDYVWSTVDQPPAGTLRPLRQRQSLLAA